MALDAGTHLFIIPDPTAASATPAVSNDVALTGTGVLGGFFVGEDMTIEEFAVTFTTAGSATALVAKLQLCRDTQLANAADIVGLPVTLTAGSTGSALMTAPSATAAVGTTIVKRYNFQLKKGDFVVINQTTGTTGGNGYFTIKCYPSGEALLGTKLQSTTVVSTLASTT